MPLQLRKHVLDPAKAQSGVWVKVFGGSFLIARYQNPRTIRLFREKASKRLIELMSADDDLDSSELTPDDVQLMLDLHNAVLAEAVILDWKDVLDEDNQPYHYSIENAIALVEKYPEIAGRQHRESLKRENFSRFHNEGAEGNS
jgi:hypothetical protein